MPGKKRVNSGPFVCYNYECACETVVLKNSFLNPFSDYQKKKRKERKSKNRFLSFEIRFQISQSIENPKPGFQNLNPDFLIECTQL